MGVKPGQDVKKIKIKDNHSFSNVWLAYRRQTLNCINLTRYDKGKQLPVELGLNELLLARVLHDLFFT